MQIIKRIAGIIALISLAVSLNVLVIKEDLFSAWLLYPLGVAALSGLVWVVLVVANAWGTRATSSRSFQGLNAAIGSAAMLGICITLYALASRSETTWDLTLQGRRDLAPQTIQMLHGLDDEVSVLCFFPSGSRMSSEMSSIARKHTERFLRRCQDETDQLDVEFLSPEVDLRRLQQLNLTRISPQGTVVIKSGLRKRSINLEGVNPRLREHEFTNALINVVRNSSPKVYFLTGHHERDITNNDKTVGLSNLAGLLRSEAYVPEQHAIKLSDPAIPQDCDILVIPAPGSDFFPEEIQALERYLERGGRLLALMDPWEPLPKENLRPWLREHLGIQLGADILLSPETREQIILTPSLDEFPQDDSGQFYGSYNYQHPITKGMSQRMLIKVARSVRLADDAPEGVVRTPLLRTKPAVWGETDFGEDQQSEIAYFDEKVDVRGPVTLAVAATMKTDAPAGESGETRDARIVVVGDADLATNGELNAQNADFLLNTMAWLSATEELISIRAQKDEQQPIIMTGGERQMVAWISTLGALQVVILAGLITYYFRRKYQ